MVVGFWCYNVFQFYTIFPQNFFWNKIGEEILYFTSNNWYGTLIKTIQGIVINEDYNDRHLTSVYCATKRGSPFGRISSQLRQSALCHVGKNLLRSASISL